MNTIETAKPLTPGELVYVRNTNMGGRAIIEGEATIVRALGNHQYKVQFRGERASYLRFVLPEHRRKEPI